MAVASQETLKPAPARERSDWEVQVQAVRVRPDLTRDGGAAEPTNQRRRLRAAVPAAKHGPAGRHQRLHRYTYLLTERYKESIGVPIST